MANIYRHKINKRLYTIERLVKDVRHLNNNAFAGIYATPYNWKGEQIFHQSQNAEVCESFVANNFEKVAFV